MDWTPTELQREYRQAARELAAAELAPAAARFEQAEQIPAAVFEELGRRGFMAVGVPRDLGGSEAGTVAYALSMMEVAQGCGATAVTMAVTNMVGEVIAAFGTDDQRSFWCPRLAKGELGAFGLSEVDAGSDPGAMRTTARQDGDEWVLDGTKQWISHGDSASVIVVWARTDGPGAKGLSCFLVPRDAAGLGVGKHESKMGLRASHTVGLVLEGLRVPASALLGSRGDGFRIAMMALDGGRIGIASQAIGIARGALAAALAHLRAQPEPQQGALFRVADAATELDAAELLALRAAHHKQRGLPFSREASIAKAFSTEAAWRVCNLAYEAVGDAAAVAGPIERALRDVRVTMIYEGTSEVQRIVIARHALRG